MWNNSEWNCAQRNGREAPCGHWNSPLGSCSACFCIKKWSPHLQYFLLLYNLQIKKYVPAVNTHKLECITSLFPCLFSVQTSARHSPGSRPDTDGCWTSPIFKLSVQNYVKCFEFDSLYYVQSRCQKSLSMGAFNEIWAKKRNIRYLVISLFARLLADSTRTSFDCVCNLLPIVLHQKTVPSVM